MKNGFFILLFIIYLSQKEIESKNLLLGAKFNVDFQTYEKPSDMNTIESDTIEIHFKKDFSIKNFLFPFFTSLQSNNIVWIFDINKDIIIKLKKYFGSPTFYYSENLEDIKYIKNDLSNLKKINEDIYIKGPFFIYVNPYENTFIDFLVNEIDNNDIDFSDDNNTLKFIQKDKEYNLINIKGNIIRLEINEEFNKNIFIIDTQGETKYILNKNNTYYDINESFKNFKIKSEEDTYINIYHNISEIFINEDINVIELEQKDIEKGIIINVTNIKDIEKFEYMIYYGYKNLIPSNLIKISYSSQLLFINNYFEKLEQLNENKNLYIYIFGKEPIFTISYINTYKFNPSSFYINITPKNNYYFIPEKNYNSKSFFEIFSCRNDINDNPINIEMFGPDGQDTKYDITTDNFLYYSSSKKMLLFNSEYEFILMSYELDDYLKFLESKIINFYIPQVTNDTIDLLIQNIKYNEEFNYKIIIIEENNGEDDLLNKLNNPCYFFQFYENNFNLSEYNYTIINTDYKNDYFFYEKINIINFNKNIYIKILSYSEKYKTVFYSKAKKIYIENIKQDNYNNESKNEVDYTILDENKEYSINNNEYIFKYNLKKNHLNNIPTIFLKYYNTYQSNNNLTELEIINPLYNMENYKLKTSGELTLNSDNILEDYGEYYFIFRNCLGIKFYIHNTINIFSLDDKTKNYLSNSDYKATESIMYFSLKLLEDKYIYIGTSCDLYFYSKTKNEVYKIFKNKKLGYGKVLKDEYFIFNFYDNCEPNSQTLAIISDYYYIDNEIPISTEINSMEMSSILLSGTRQIIVDLKSYKDKPYIILGNTNNHKYYCSESKDIEYIVRNEQSYNILKLDSHIIDLSNIDCPNNKTYIIIKFSNTIFELIFDYNIVEENQDTLIYEGEKTIVYNIKTNKNSSYYIFAFSNYENLQDLNKTNIDYSKVLFNVSNNYIIKLHQIKNDHTELKIRFYEIDDNIEITSIKENELSDLFYLDFDKSKIIYYINLLKKDVLYYHYNILGETEVFLLKENIQLNHILIDKIIKEKIINEELFDYQESNKIIIKPYQILAIKYNVTKLVQYLYMSSIYQDFVMNNPVKYIKAYKKYILKKERGIVLDPESDSQIKLLTYNNSIYHIFDKNNTNKTYENLEENLCLQSDKDTIIYLFYRNKQYYSVTKCDKNFFENKILYFDDWQREIYYDYSFNQNYKSRPLLLNEMEPISTNFKFYYNPFNKNISLDIYFYIYTNMYHKVYSLMNLNPGLNRLKDDDKYMSQNIYNNEKLNLYYQYITCEAIDNEKSEMHLYIYRSWTFILYNTFGNFFRYKEHSIYTIFFGYDQKQKGILNYILTEYEETDEESNNYYNFNLKMNIKDELLIEILPIDKNKEFDYYLVYTITNGTSTEINNLLNNICFNLDLIEYDNNSTFFIEKITLRGNSSYQNVIINMTEYNLTKGDIIYMNILVKGIILDKFEKIYNYSTKYYEIQEYIPDGGEESNEMSSSTLALIIVFSIVGAILIFVIIFILYRKLNKSKKLNNNSDIYKEKYEEEKYKEEKYKEEKYFEEKYKEEKYKGEKEEYELDIPKEVLLAYPSAN